MVLYRRRRECRKDCRHPEAKRMGAAAMELEGNGAQGPPRRTAVPQAEARRAHRQCRARPSFMIPNAAVALEQTADFVADVAVYQTFSTTSPEANRLRNRSDRR